MSAKKSPKGASEKKTSATADPKRAEAPVAPVRNPFNPLPADAVGPRLLVCLKAEKIIEKLRLKERWEDPSGWDFEMLCALVASEMGEDFLLSGEKELSKQATHFHSKRDIDAIKKKCEPRFVDDGGGVISVRAETIEEYLILGLGTPSVPITDDPALKPMLRLQSALVKLLDVSPNAVKPRTSERAKLNVSKRYANHLAKQEIRLKKLATRTGPARLSIRSQTSLLREVFGELALKQGVAGKADLGVTVDAAMRKAGIKLPQSR